MMRLVMAVALVTLVSSVARPACAQAPQWLWWGESQSTAVPTSAANPLPIQPIGGGSGMLTNGSNATLPDARYNIGPNNACNPVTDFHADPTGHTDVAAAVNSCAAVTKNGQSVNVYLPGGLYYTKGQLNLSNGQCLYGDGRGITTITVDQGFSSSAAGVINLTGREQQAPCVHDLDIEFAQPSDQTSRANFKTLAAGCTSNLGGSGCKYPPAIYMASGASNRALLYNLRIARAWDGINDQAAGGFFFHQIEMSALNVGVTLANGSDVGYLDDFHFWPFDIDTSTNLYNDVYADGGTFAANIGEVDGIHVNGFTTVDARVALTSAFTWGTFTDLKLDGNNSTIEIAGVSGPGLQIQGVYTSGTASGSNTHCQIDVGITGGAGNISITNISGNASGSGNPGTTLCMSGGTVTLVGGSMSSFSTTAREINQLGGNLSVTGVKFIASPGAGAYTVPLVNANGGQINFCANSIRDAAGTNVGGLVVVTDDAANSVIGNNFNGWTFTPPGPLGVYTANGGQMLAPNGTAAAPSYSFSHDLKTGLFRNSTNTLGFSVNGGDIADYNLTASNYFYFLGDNGVGQGVYVGPNNAVPATLVGPLEVASTTGNTTVDVVGAASNTPSLQMRRSFGTLASPTAISSTTGMLIINSEGYDGSAWAVGAQIHTEAGAAWTSSSHSANMIFSTTPIGSTTLTTALTLTTDQHAIFGGGILAANLPTSCSGQPSGELWIDSGAVKVCP